SNAGGLGSLGCAMLSVGQMTSDAAKIRPLSNRSFMLSFFTHKAPGDTAAQERAWQQKPAPHYNEVGGEAASGSAAGARRPFDEEYCDAVLKIAPRIAHFHFGMPKPELVKRLKNAGIIVLSTGTTVAECKHVVELGAEAVVAQGVEAGGHRGIFLS